MTKEEKKVINWEDVPLVMTVTDIMRVMQVGKDVAMRLVHSSDFPAFKAGRQYFVSRDSFIAWVKIQRGDLRV